MEQLGYNVPIKERLSDDKRHGEGELEQISAQPPDEPGNVRSDPKPGKAEQPEQARTPPAEAKMERTGHEQSFRPPSFFCEHNGNNSPKNKSDASADPALSSSFKLGGHLICTMCRVGMLARTQREINFAPSKLVDIKREMNHLLQRL